MTATMPARVNACRLDLGLSWHELGRIAKIDPERLLDEHDKGYAGLTMAELRRLAFACRVEARWLAFSDDEQVPCLAAIIRAAEHKYRLPGGSLPGRARTAPYAKARRYAVYRARCHGFGSKEIGRALQRDHSTILHIAKWEGDK